MTTMARAVRTGIGTGIGGTVARTLSVPEPAWHLRESVRPGVHGGTGDEAGPVDAAGAAALRAAPSLPMGPLRASLSYTLREGDVTFRAAERNGDVFRTEFAGGPGQVVLVSHPAHVASLMTRPDDAPSATRFSPLRPIVGPDSVLTAVGPRHKQQRRLLLPQFHGRAVTDYQQRIDAAQDRLGDRQVLLIGVLKVGRQQRDLVEQRTHARPGVGHRSDERRAPAQLGHSDVEAGIPGAISALIGLLHLRKAGL